jgi:2-succinyl-5-enolpyruvyl-6-hydroxy-3-cyclohexene-1-carboxylate synthase
VLQALPADSYLQLGNSMSIRYASFIGLGADIAATGIKVNANRGTSGIDGSLSTTVGAALATEKITTLITGDLAFFYDRNALWQQHLPPNLRVVILNNRGGGIFKLIEGPGNLPPAELEQYFFTPQPLTAKNTAAVPPVTHSTFATATPLPTRWRSTRRARRRSMSWYRALPAISLPA